jgi:NAD(P)H-hydrate repair Nnr-like enzyme with NAD(P)H-hydrate dehydratase domain
MFCVAEAAVPIKSYSPELIVHPLLHSDASMTGLSADQRGSELASAADKIALVFPRIDALVIGPGLGRDAAVLELSRELIRRAKEAEMPIVLDGDALFLVSQAPDTIKGYAKAVLTPNAVGGAALRSGHDGLEELMPLSRWSTLDCARPQGCCRTWTWGRRPKSLQTNSVKRRSKPLQARSCYSDGGGQR